MIRNFQLVAGQVAVLFILMGVGAACRRTKLLGEEAVAALTKLLILLVTPCVIVDSFNRPYDSGMLGGLAEAAALATALHLLLIPLSRLLCRGGAPRDREIRRLAVVFSNAGFMGIPLEQAILGPRGVFFGAVYVAVFNCFIWTWGLSRTREGRRGLWNRQVLVNPGTIGLALGLPLFFLSVRLPAFCAAPVSSLAALNTPLAMIVIGWGLAGANLRGFLRDLGAHGAAACRLLLSPALMTGLLLALGAFTRPDRDMAVAMTLAASAPVAAMVSILFTRDGRAPDAAIGLVSGTTLLSLLTMPPVIALAMTLFR